MRVKRNIRFLNDTIHIHIELIPLNVACVSCGIVTSGIWEMKWKRNFMGDIDRVEPPGVLSLTSD